MVGGMSSHGFFWNIESSESSADWKQLPFSRERSASLHGSPWRISELNTLSYGLLQRSDASGRGSITGLQLVEGEH